jgi:hypothetical protein
MNTEKEKTVRRGPVNLGGAIGRIVVLPDGSGQVETWGGNGWEFGGADAFSVMMAPDASPAILRKYRVPKEYWNAIVLEEDRLAQDKKQG